MLSSFEQRRTFHRSNGGDVTSRSLGFGQLRACKSLPGPLETPNNHEQRTSGTLLLIAGGEEEDVGGQEEERIDRKSVFI